MAFIEVGGGGAATTVVVVAVVMFPYAVLVFAGWLIRETGDITVLDKLTNLAKAVKPRMPNFRRKRGEIERGTAAERAP